MTNKRMEKFLAMYFAMGQYNEDDSVPPELVGFDCPFDDSPTICAQDENELEEKNQRSLLRRDQLLWFQFRGLLSRSYL